MSAKGRPTEQGYTLMEIVTVSVPFALLALSLFAVFMFTLTFSGRVGGDAEAVRQGRLTLQRMVNELRETSAAPGSIVIWSRDEGAAQDGVGFLAARVNGPGRAFRTDTEGTPLWDHAVHYFHDLARGELWRFTVEANTVSSPPPQTQGRLLAREVRRLRVGRQRNLVTVTLTIGRPSGDAVLEMAVRPRN
ncbi:MAG: hypothetical protein ACT4P5_18915 [Armatimonadota bacterium]